MDSEALERDDSGITPDADTAGVHFTRRLQAQGNSGRRDDEPASVTVDQPVSDYLDSVAAGREPAFRCMAIGAARHDGITWAGQDVAAVVTGHAGHLRPRLTVVSGIPSDGGPPKLFELFSERKLARAARRAGAPKMHSRVRSWLTLLIVVVAILITAAISLLTPPHDSGPDKSATASLLDSRTLINALVLATLGVVAQVLIAFVQPTRRVARAQRIIEWINNQRDNNQYGEFVSTLAFEFSGATALRCLIVDDFGLLDKPTRDVLVAYLRDYTSDTRPELWVVFDPSDALVERQFRKDLERLTGEARKAGERKAPYGVRRTQHYELAALTNEERYELAQWAGHPERSGYRTVKSIVAETDDTLGAYFENEIPPDRPEQDPAKYQAFQLLYLLGLANAWGDAVELPEQQLIRKLAESRRRSRVLREVLTGPALSRTGLTTRIAGLRTYFKPVVTEIRDRVETRLAVSVEAGEILERTSGRFGLASADVGHLFWALYRHDNRAATIDDPFWLGKLAQHLDRAAAPRDRIDLFGAESETLTDRLIQAILHTIDDSLRLGQLYLVPDLVQRGENLLGDGDTRYRALLMPRARNAYAVLGDDAVLRVLLELRRPDEAEPAAESPGIESSSPLGLFVLASASDVRQKSMLAALAPGPDRGDLDTAAALRGSWLALSLRPFLKPEATPDLLLTTLRANPEVRSATTRILQELTADPHAPQVADLVNLSLGLWCWALSGVAGQNPLGVRSSPADEIADALVTVSILAGELGSAKPRPEDPDRGHVDLVRDCLAEELLLVAGAAAVLVRTTWRDLDPGPAAKLDGLVVDVLPALGIRVPRGKGGAVALDDAALELLDRMTLLHITWRVLGYTQLATVLNLRRVQFAALLPSDAEAEASDGAERSLIEDRDRTDLLGLLANLVAAARALPSREAAAEAFVHGVTRALDGPASEELLAQLCLLAVGQAHSYQTDVEHQIEYLMSDRSDSSGTRLDRLLKTFADRVLPMMSLWLTNIARRSDEYGTELVAALMRRADDVADDDIRAELQERLQIFELVRRQAAGELVDVDVELDSWTNTQSSSYPFLLYRLLVKVPDPAPARLQTAINTVFADFDHYQDTTARVLLAIEAAMRCLDAEGARRRRPPEFDETQLVAVLRRDRAEWSGSLTVENNIEILTYLQRRDSGNKAEYAEQLIFWREERLRLLEERKLSQMLSAGRFALLLLTYLEILDDYGLTIAYPSDDTSREPTPLDELRHANAQPFLTVRGRPVLNARFLSDARALFRAESTRDDVYDDARSDVNDAARNALPQLFAMLIDLDQVPEQIRTILRRHRDMVRERLNRPMRIDPSMQ